MFAEKLAALEGSHDVLAVKAPDLRKDDILIQGACLRRLRRHAGRVLGYAQWQVSHLAEDSPVLGHWQFLDDGVKRVVVLRPRKAAADLTGDEALERLRETLSA